MVHTVSLSQQDWSLHRKGPIDQARHAQKVREAIKSNLGEIVSEESIITSDGQSIVKVPIRSLELPHFRFDGRRQQRVGQGEGGTRVGDVVGRTGGQGPGKGKQAGNQPGVDYYEAEVTIDEIAALIFEDFGLPNLQRKDSLEVTTETVKFTEVQRRGVMSNLDKRRTILENIRRNARNGSAAFGGLTNDDLRFKTWTTDVRRESNAVVIAMRDISGSMGEFEKYVTRSFYFWMVRFLRTKYQHVQIVFIVHHTEAKEVDEQAFFTLGEGGGTRVSSAYQLAKEIIDERFAPSRWNIYPFHFSDGDNWGDSDNRTCVELVSNLIDRANLFGYGEIQQVSHGTSTLMSAFGDITDEKFIPVIIKGKEDVYPALKRFFSTREIHA